MEQVTRTATEDLARDEYASWGARLGALILDFIISCLAYGSIVAIITLAWWTADPDGLRAAGEDDTYAMLLFLGYVPFILLWEVAWVRSRGMGKPGQRMAGFRVAEAKGLGRCEPGRAVGRAVSKLLVNAVGSGTGSIVTAFTIGLSGRHQAVHDMMASTVCVRTDALRRRGLFGGGTEGVAAVGHLAAASTPVTPTRSASSTDSGAMPQRGPFL